VGEDFIFEVKKFDERFSTKRLIINC